VITLLQICSSVWRWKEF